MRKTLAIIMMIAMVFCYMPLTGFADTEVSTTSVNTSGFIDMPNNWSTEALSKAVGNGLLEGFKEKSGTFIKPSDPLTRAQMATIVNRAFGAKGTANLTGVKDVPQKAWYTAEMQKAVKMGTMKLDSKMRPNDPITRQEAFTVLARAFKMADGTMANLEKFSDKEKVSSWAVSSLGALARVGYIQGADGKLNPLSKITRAEFAVVMDNMIKEYINKAGTVTQVHEGNLMINVPDVILKDITVKGDLILGDGIGEGNVTLENVIVKGNLIARGGGVNSIVINGGGVDGKVVIAKVDGQIRVFVNGAQVDVVVIDDGKDDIIVEGTVGTLEITAPDVPVVLNNASVRTIEVNTQGPANLQVGAGSTVANVVVSGNSSGTNLKVDGKVTNVETSAPGTNVQGTGQVSNVTAKEGANNTKVETPNTSISNQGAEGVTAGGGTEVPSGSTATNSNTGGEATVQPTTGGTTGGGGGGGTAPDTTAPILQGVYPAVTSGQTTHWILAGDETFTFSVDAYDAGGLYELEIDHSLEGTLPEFSVYADESDPYGGDGAQFAAAGVTVTYSAVEMKWDIDFGDPITDTFVTNGGVTFYLVIKDVAGNQWGTMYGTTPDNTFAYTFERADVVNRTQKTSHASIQAAIDGADAGDVIYVAEGTYHENISIGENNIQLLSTGNSLLNEEATSGEGDIGISISADHVQIDGFTVNNAYAGIVINGAGCSVVNSTIDSCANGMLLYMETTDCNVENNTISNTLGYGIVVGYPGGLAGTSNNTISGNAISLVGMDGIYADIYSSGNRYINNTITNATRDGISLYKSNNDTVQGNTIDGSGANGITLFGSYENSINDNDISNNAAYGIEIRFSWGTGDPSDNGGNVLSENTISDNNGGVVQIFEHKKDGYSNEYGRNIALDNNFGDSINAVYSEFSADERIRVAPTSYAKTYDELVDSLDDGLVETVRVVDNITTSNDLTIPAGKTIIVNPSKVLTIGSEHRISNVGEIIVDGTLNIVNGTAGMDGYGVYKVSDSGSILMGGQPYIAAAGALKVSSGAIWLNQNTSGGATYVVPSGSEVVIQGANERSGDFARYFLLGVTDSLTVENESTLSIGTTSADFKGVALTGYMRVPDGGGANLVDKLVTRKNNNGSNWDDTDVDYVVTTNLIAGVADHLITEITNFGDLTNHPLGTWYKWTSDGWQSIPGM